MFHYYASFVHTKANFGVTEANKDSLSRERERERGGGIEGVMGRFVVFLT